MAAKKKNTSAVTEGEMVNNRPTPDRIATSAVAEDITSVTAELRHGDIFSTRLPDESADLVVVHQVLHYLADPAAAVKEAARIVAECGRLIIADFAPHRLEFLREQHQHRRLGFAEPEMVRWLGEAGLGNVRVTALPPSREEGLTVKIWTAERGRQRQRNAA